MKHWFAQHRPARLIVIIVIVGIVGLGGLWGIDVLRNGMGSGAATGTGNNGVFFLARPVMAVESTFLDEEAGITAYTNLGRVIDLSMARTGFKTIEQETADYIVGSIALPDLPETEDVHCFVHSDGWIVTYYLAAEPASKIIGWVYSLPGSLVTKLKVGIDEMCTTLETVAGDISYYHFHYPLANRLMMIAESQQGLGTDNFNLKIPGEFTVYERSWSHRCVGTLTGEEVTQCGTLTFGQLGPNMFHVIQVTSEHYYADAQSYLKLDGQQVNYIGIGDAYSSYSQPDAYTGIALVYLEP